ncbi:MAG: ASKHA domain-containing protein [Desulfobacterales bacterium]|jgi:uncharacterized 2Fe-2S/4Fe-4S cluster protein (DUF4445 family)
MVQNSKRKIRITFEGQSYSAERGQTVLEALISNGFILRSDCGGKGRCGKCRIKIRASDPTSLSPPSEGEQKILGQKGLAAGYRLACCITPLGDVSLEIPASSRLSESVLEKAPPLLLEKHTFPEIPGERPKDHYGLAVDLGTTTIAVYLCDLAARRVSASIAMRNPQAIFGDDVMSRISAISTDPNLLKRLQRMAIKTIEWGTQALIGSSRIEPTHIKTMIVVGNSTMIHILVDQSPASIGVYPYEPQFVEEKRLLAEEIGLRFNPKTNVRTLPLITGFIGADTVGAAIAAELEETPVGTMLVDVGTNGEIMFLGKDGVVATSCATGPAFEGATIHHGMQAVPGAINAIKIDRKKRKLHYSVIQNQTVKTKRPAGICGTGVISAVAELLRAKIILKDGAFNSQTNYPNLEPDENGTLQFILVPPEKTADERAIVLKQKDVRAIQLAKGAIRTGIELLCLETNIELPEKILLAGAFGSYINPQHALAIGMLPGLKPKNIEGVGNAAGAGAILTLFDERFAEKARELSRSTRVLDLSTHPDFQDTFIDSLAFPDM